jgi:hypothetical protein
MVVVPLDVVFWYATINVCPPSFVIIVSGFVKLEALAARNDGELAI